MTTLKFADTHNMVAFLAKLAESEGFEQIVDFLNAHTINAKTTAWNEFSSTMASAIICLATNQKFNFSKYIFGSIVKNLENVPGKFLMYPRFVQVFVNQQLEGMSNHKRIYIAPSYTKKIFRNIRRVGKGFCGRDTPLFQTIMVQDQEEVGEGSEMPTDPLYTPIIIQPSTSQPQKKQRSRRSKRKDTEDDASKQGRKIDDIDKDAEITLIDETQGRYGDDLMFDTGVLDDEEVFAGQDMDEKKINVAEKEVSTADPTLIEIRSAKSKVKEVVIGEQSESTTRTRPQQLPLKDKGKGIIEEPEKPTKKKDQIRHDEEVAQRLQAQMQAELEEEDRLVRQREEEANIVSWDNVQAMIDVYYQMAQQRQAEEQEKLSIEEKSKLFVQLLEARKKQFAAIRANEKRNKPPTKAQKINTMSTYLKNMTGYKHNHLKNKSFDDIQKLIEVVLDKEEVAIDAIPLETKTPSIVDYKINKEGKKTYYQIIRADGSSKMYLVFSHMLKSFDKEDLETLWKLEKAKHGSTWLEEGYERVLWGDLKTMFDPHVEDKVVPHNVMYES
ncbi:hypothetical protein Tco_0821855 [Tanacetum coccineum]|uniref:Uncharacterized protein n=1 Tax=Tanacetum coccineum TaxID=301880 RepID=A0ABQ5AEB9_9ASTR